MALRQKKAIEILKGYNGLNPYILRMRQYAWTEGNLSALSEFAIDFIIANEHTEPRYIGKTVRLTDWCGENLKEKYEIEFIPEKFLIMTYLGETKTVWHVTGKYRKSMNPTEFFLPKKGVMENFTVGDYHDLKVDFDRFDNLSREKNPQRVMKPHQKEAVQFLLSRKKCILADDMGLGKSLELSVAAIEGNFDSVVIICPASLKTNWKKELMWYVPERDITIVDSFQTKTKGELEEILGYAVGKSGLSKPDLLQEAVNRGKWTDNRFVIINYDVLDEVYKIPQGRSKEAIETAERNSPLLRFIKNRKSLIIIDEAHRLSNNTSIRYKIIKNLINRGNPDSIYLATGTPITNNPQNLYCLLQLIGEPITDDWQYYMDRFCGAMKIPAKGEKSKWTEEFIRQLNRNKGLKRQSYYDLTSEEREDLKKFINTHAKKITIAKTPTNLDELKLKIQHIYLRRTKEDLNSNLPGKTVHEVFYEFDDSQLTEYNKLWDEYETAQLEADPTKEINKELLEGAIYRQYCSNQMIPNTIRMVEEFISKGEKVVIATCYDDELYTLKKHFGEKCVVYNGKMTGKKKDAAQEAFMNDPNVMVFIGQIIAAGVGLTLTSSHILVFNNIDFVPGNCRQMEDRIYRIGQTKPVDIYYQIFKDTQYEKIWNIVLRKELVINQVIKKEDEK